MSQNVLSSVIKKCSEHFEYNGKWGGGGKARTHSFISTLEALCKVRSLILAFRSVKHYMPPEGSTIAAPLKSLYVQAPVTTSVSTIFLNLYQACKSRIVLFMQNVMCLYRFDWISWAASFTRWVQAVLLEMHTFSCLRTAGLKANAHVSQLHLICIAFLTCVK